MNLSDFNAMLDYIETYEPGHPELSWLKSKGLTLTSGILIQKIYNALLDAKPAPIKQTRHQDTDDAIIRSYNSQLTKLFTQRARLSNTFHISAGNHEDVQIADQVIDVQREIDRVMKDKRYYQERKELPPVAEQEDVFEIPSDPFELMRKMENVRTNLAHAKKRLRDCDPKKEPKKYADKEKTIERLTKHKMYLEQAKRDKADQSAGVQG